ncbi:hypothetical protein PL263_18375 [Methylomonas sp. EFPC3]|uniref:hypothetical protein n=1 Tax=Methylomonas sp. EFPC3 TaxID=3021710 RepID=UPI0024164B8E|nr:hypothetical protein [Methylomonas sp. EFPC3]WFP50047.1 hypothetical protein PL263_18375 [Methylomonas sp. EFPC3]
MDYSKTRATIWNYAADISNGHTQLTPHNPPKPLKPSLAATAIPSNVKPRRV